MLGPHCHLREVEIGQIPLAVEVVSVGLVLELDAQRIEEHRPSRLEPASEAMALVRRFNRLKVVHHHSASSNSPSAFTCSNIGSGGICRSSGHSAPLHS